MKRRLSVLLILGCLLTARPAAQTAAPDGGVWIRTDLHIHTTMSDGDESPATIARYVLGKGLLDAMMFTDHGGHFFRVDGQFRRIDDAGVPFSIKNYDTLIAVEGTRYKTWSRTLEIAERAFPEVLRLRRQYPSATILQGLEWDIPGHDHCTVGILSDSVAAIADFHAQFDRNDTLPLQHAGLVRRNKDEHRNAVEGVRYLRDHFPGKSFVVINHPSRKLKYTVADLRDLHSAAPDVVLGFEGIPGHQKNPDQRCKYSGEKGDGKYYHSRTYGGADLMLARVGGVWDAMLGEGRKFWVFSGSDFHRAEEDDWPGAFSVNYVRTATRTETALVEGMRSGNMFTQTGGLIEDLSFTASTGATNAVMGGTLMVKGEQSVTVSIAWKNGGKAALDHLDLITGEVHGMLTPDSAAYASPANTTAVVRKRFLANEWEHLSGGRCRVTVTLPAGRSMYVRLRGTSVPVGTVNETDAKGEPLCDQLAGPNTAAIAHGDLWFYSNPIFITVQP